MIHHKEPGPHTWKELATGRRCGVPGGWSSKGKKEQGPLRDLTGPRGVNCTPPSRSPRFSIGAVEEKLSGIISLLGSGVMFSSWPRWFTAQWESLRVWQCPLPMVATAPGSVAVCWQVPLRFPTVVLPQHPAHSASFPPTQVSMSVLRDPVNPKHKASGSWVATGSVFCEHPAAERPFHFHGDVLRACGD